MPPERKFRDIISPNRPKGGQFSPEAKEAMLALLHHGLSARAVADQFGTDHKCVTRIFNRF